MGASLAMAVVAADPSSVQLVVAINPPLADPDALEGLQWRQSRGHDWIDGPELGDGEVGYTRFPITALIEMVEGVGALRPAEVTVPVLLVRGALDDSADPDALEVFAAQLGGPVTGLVLPGSGHVATLGPDLPQLVAAITELR
jgi:pimeloyl-ACP methyl ester carboxylesterase